MLKPADNDTLHESSYEESIPSNVFEYFTAVENGQFPFFNNTTTHVSLMRNGTGETLLITAARCGHANIVERLVNDIDIEETDNDGWNALLNAAYEGHAQVVRVLLNAVASVEQPDLMGWTPLMWACYKNRPEAVDELLAGRAHVNVFGEEDGLTPLIIASGRGYPEVVQRLLQAGAQVNSSDKFGSTALIWAARSGHKQIVESLLSAGAEVDAVGMQACTALMLATRGNHIDVVEAILEHDPNVNVVDYSGLSALGMAAREGFTEIAQALIQSGAYVNTVDRYSTSILGSAVRSGNLQIVKMLLEKHADLNARDSENRTPLHLAIDKSFTDIVLALLEKRPNLELKNKDGQTVLLRAVQNRDVAIAQLLVNMGAKISATDNQKDNALHLALRARSKKMTQTLLVNPSDSKLLYRPNKMGETPYSIDQESSSPILPRIFGPIGQDMDLKSLIGFDAYSDVLADVVCEPNLSLPLTIGLYAKWGSGKSLLLPKIRDSMKSFSRTWLDGLELYWSWMVVFVLLVICVYLGLLASAIATLIPPHSSQPIYSIGIGLSVFVLLISGYWFVYYGSENWLWNRSIITARHIARWIARFKVVLSVLTLNAPIRTNKELTVSPVSFLFADDHRLSFIGGEQALANIVLSLFEAAEYHYGLLAVRLFCAFKRNHTERTSKFQTLCGIPILVYIIVMILTLFISLVLFIISGYRDTAYEHVVLDERFITALVFFCISVSCGAILLYFISVRMILNLPKRRIARLNHNVHQLPFERMVQKLQREVDLLVSLVTTLDAFTNGQTRLVIMIDGLDSCEQSKMVQLLDSVVLFFCTRQNSPFIVLMAFDPNIVVSSIQQNLRGIGGAPLEITGHDYIKNVVSMPFYLDHASLRKMQNNRQRAITSLLGNNNSSHVRDRKHSTSATFRESRLSLRDGGLSSKKDVNMANELGHLFPSYDYFANINPRTMRRIVNSIALTGRLLRTFDVDFTWGQLYAWISLIEQWPLRMCWLIDAAQSLHDDSLPLIELYMQIKGKIVVTETLVDRDRNSQDFEAVLRKMSSVHRLEQLTVGHAKNFSHCTSNLDPYLKKLVREQRVAGGEAEPEDQDQDEPDQIMLLKETIGTAEHLFDDPTVWTGIQKSLVKMSILEVVALLQRLNIPQDRLQRIVQTFNENNLNGLVLQSCDMNELKQILKIPLGDWTLVQLLVETLRKWKPFLASHAATALSASTANANGQSNIFQSQQPSTLNPPMFSAQMMALSSVREEDQQNGIGGAPIKKTSREETPSSFTKNPKVRTHKFSSAGKENTRKTNPTQMSDADDSDGSQRSLLKNSL